MVTAEAAMAVVRATRPVLRCAHDGIAFAANAVFLADGYSLCSVGHAALLDPVPADEEEVGIDGWNSMENCYAFLYSKEEEGKKKFILMKCVVIADFLAIDALDLEAQYKEPSNLQINVKDFFSEEQHKNYKDMYKNFKCFINILNTTLLVELGHMDAAAAQIPNVENTSSINSFGNVMLENPSTRTTELAGSDYVMWEIPGTRMIEPAGSEDVLWENPSTRLFYPPVVLLGHDDTFPVLGVGFYPHSGGTGGSMHFGPNDPCFFPTNPSTPIGDLGHSGGSSHPDLESFQQGPDFF